jgi:hypothetical protein
MSGKSEPVFHDDLQHRQQARNMRNAQWAFADLVLQHGTVWFCWWDKDRRHADASTHRANLYVTGLITGVDLLDWMNRHEDWWQIGEWCDSQYAAPVQLTEVGKVAIQNRHLYDMEPVYWGLADPGHCAIPAEQVTA